MSNDTQQFLGAKTRFGHAIKTYDGGFGPLWVLRNSLGIEGIVRAPSWEDAYSIAEDEIFQKVEDSERESWEKEFGSEFWEDICWQEQFGYRSDGGYYWKDLNGDYCDLLTPELAEYLEIKLLIKRNTVRVREIEQTTTQEELES